MIGTRPIAFLLAAALLVGAAPLTAQEVPTAADYAKREAESTGLADFQGGFHGVVIAVVILAAIGCVVLLTIDWGFHGHGHHYHRLPHAEGRGHPRP
ncbi:MAG TPA: hypothetical protein VF950_13605 [Planctomycetota bacterium]